MDDLEAKEEDDLISRLAHLRDVWTELSPINDNKISRYSKDYDVFLSIGEVEEARKVRARIEAVKDANNRIMDDIGRIQKRLKQIEEMKLKP